MKKNNVLKSLIFCILVFSIIFCGINFNNIHAYATTEETTTEDTSTEDTTTGTDDEILNEDVVDDSEIFDQIFDDLMRGGYEIEVRIDLEDTHLYSALLQIIKDYIKETYNYTYTYSTLYSTMFKNFTDITIEDMAVESLTGFEKFKLPALESLTITGNSITAVNKEIFEPMTNLKTLNLACNDISDIDLSLATSLENINLSSNNLSEFDASTLEAQDLIINLAHNNFSSIKDISLPTRVNTIKLNLINNNINDLTDEYFEYSKLTMNLGLQGLKSSNMLKLDTTMPIKFYKTNIDGVVLKLYKIGVLEDTLVKTISDSDVTNNYININSLSVGDYYYEYQMNDSLLYEKNNSEREYYKTYKFSVIPAKCTFQYEYKGKIYETFNDKVTGKVKVTINAEEGAKILYSVNGGEWQEGNEIMCDKGGNYSISAKTIIDGVESEVITTLVRTSLNTIISDGLMLVLVLLFTLTLFLIVVPFVSKKWFRN